MLALQVGDHGGTPFLAMQRFFVRGILAGSVK